MLQLAGLHHMLLQAECDSVIVTGPSVVGDARAFPIAKHLSNQRTRVMLSNLKLFLEVILSKENVNVIILCVRFNQNCTFL